MSRGGPLARAPEPAVRAIVPRTAPRALPPGPMPTPVPVPVPVYVPTTVVAAPPAPAPPPPAPGAPGQNGLDMPTAIAMTALGAFTYFAFLREPEPLPPPAPDPFSSPCRGCNPLLMLGLPASEPARCDVHPEAHEAPKDEEPRPSPVAVALLTGSRG